MVGGANHSWPNWFFEDLCVQRAFVALFLVDCRCLPFSSTRRDALTRGTQSCRFTLQGTSSCEFLVVASLCVMLRIAVRMFCWFVFACGLCVQLAFCCVFDCLSHSYVLRCHKSRGPRIRFHVPPRRHPCSVRDISCSLVLRVGSCQLMRIQGLRAVTKVHRQFVVRRVLMRRFIFRVGSHFALSSTTQTRTGTQTTPGIFRSLHAVGSLCSAPSSHAEVCRCSDSIDWTQRFASTLHHCNNTILWAIPVAASCWSSVVVRMSEFGRDLRR